MAHALFILITKATETCSEYVILVAFPRQQWLRERASMLRYTPVLYIYHFMLVNTEIIYRVIRNDCRGFNNLPPRSPDATPCDFLLWG